MPRHKPFLLRGVIKEFKDRVVLWPSDWVDGFEVKTLSAAIFIFLSSIFPALAFGTYLNSSTKGILGISEVRLCKTKEKIFAIFGIVFVTLKAFLRKKSEKQRTKKFIN